ncbi:MAG: hypothetical protein KQ78_01954 [Candidatus Izimaplasma bacterium HR2]|nr:MAG: hypothetical protein KQ78_01954 [Candidatus Izimaplasma bacterium HR2]
MAKRIYTEKSALKAITSAHVTKKVIELTGFSGLTELGAIDFLRYQLGYKVIGFRR